ncbi:MAG: alpha,alpha-phosphotrehalase, partial [Mycoplasma sp.]|nr:alpha,alpha-phosphotrehalase [Mycoplasma sp.]
VSDYKKIDPKFGTINDFEKLIIEAKKKNIFIMMDMIFNHCSTEHIWFKKAISGDKEYQDRFFFLKNDSEPTNWKSKFGGSAWEYNEELSLWYLHLFDKHQADLNWQNNKLKSDIYQVIEFWINLGVKGLRFDVINLIGKPNEFKNDNQSFGKHFYTDHPL